MPSQEAVFSTTALSAVHDVLASNTELTVVRRPGTILLGDMPETAGQLGNSALTSDWAVAPNREPIYEAAYLDDLLDTLHGVIKRALTVRDQKDVRVSAERLRLEPNLTFPIAGRVFASEIIGDLITQRTMRFRENKGAHEIEAVPVAREITHVMKVGLYPDRESALYGGVVMTTSLWIRDLCGG